MKVEELMTTDVITVGPESTLKEAAAILAERGISGLPVIDADGALIGVFSEGDVVFRESGGTPKSRLRRQLRAGHAGHHVIGQKKVEIAVATEHAKCLGA